MLHGGRRQAFRELGNAVPAYVIAGCVSSFSQL